MNFSQQSKKALETRTLKQIYPDVEQRKKFVQKKLLGSKLSKPVVVRLEPYPKTLLPKKYTTFIMEENTKLQQVVAVFNQKVMKLTSRQALYLFSNKSFVLLQQTVLDLKNKQNEEDGIVYLIYCETNPFG